MTFDQITNLLERSIPAGLRTLIKGPPGCGKTAAVAKAAATLKADLMIFHGSVSDATDVKGLPSNVNGKAEFLPYGEWRKLMETKRLTVCLLEDLIQTPVSVQAALMQVMHGGRINGHRIPECVKFVGATNDTSHMAGGSMIIEPVKSRFHSIVTLDVSAEDWDHGFAIPAGMPPLLRAYFKAKPDRLIDFKPSRELTNSPCPRGWEAVGHWLNLGVMDAEVLGGAVGIGDASMYLAFEKAFTELPPIKDILANPKGEKVPDKADMRFAVTCALASVVSVKTIGPALDYMRRMAKSFEHLFVKEAWRQHPKLSDSQELKVWLSEPDNTDIILG